MTLPSSPRFFSGFTALELMARRKYLAKKVLCTTLSIALLNTSLTPVYAMPMHHPQVIEDVSDSSQIRTRKAMPQEAAQMSAYGISTFFKEVAYLVSKGISYVLEHPGQALTLGLAAQVAATNALNPLTNDFLINQNTTGIQGYPSVAGLSNGNAFVVWERNYDTYGRVVLPAGTALTGDFTINQNTVGNQEVPSVARLSNGNAFVVWQGDQSGTPDIYGRVLAPSGAALTSDITINQNTAATQTRASVAALSNGNAFVVWHGNQAGTYDIYGRVMAPNGTALTNDFTINQNTAGDQTYPTVAALSNGNAFVVWMGVQTGDYDIYGCVLASNGSPITGEFTINQNTIGNQGLPVAALSDINALVAWQGDQTGNTDIYGRVFFPNGTALTNDFTINQNTTGTQSAAAVAALSNGNALVAWQGDQTGNTDIYGRVVAPNGTALTNDFTINQNATGEQYIPRVAALSNGNAFVVWQGDQSGTSDIYGRIFDLSDPVTTTGFQTTTGPQTTAQPTLIPILLGVSAGVVGLSVGGSLITACAIGGFCGVKQYKKHQQKSSQNSSTIPVTEPLDKPSHDSRNSEVPPEEPGIKAEIIVGENKRKFQIIGIMDPLTFQKLKKITGVPFDEEKIRAGAHGTVKPAVEMNPETGKPVTVVAAKFITGEQTIAHSKNEIEVLTALGKDPQNNPYTTYLLDSYFYSPKGEETLIRSLPDVTKIIFTPWFSGGDGGDLLKRLPKLTNANHKAMLLTSLIGSLYRAVSYLNGRGFYHNDINPGNVMVDMETGNFRLTDFGSASQSKQLDSTVRIRKGYISPELLGIIEGKTTVPADAAKSDSWSSTVVSWQFLSQSSESPFQNVVSQDMEGAITRLAQQNLYQTNGLELTLIKIFQKRLTATQALTLESLSKGDQMPKKQRIETLLSLMPDYN